MISGSQSIQYNDWHIIHSPVLSLDWLYELLELELPTTKDADNSVLKLEDDSLILKLESDIGFVAAKHYRKRSIKRVLRNTFGQSRAHRSWQYANYLLDQGLNTPEPLAFIEEQKVGLKWRAWYICRFDESATCDEYYLHADSLTPAMVNNASAIVDMFIKLRECRLSHGDFKASNLLMSAEMPSLIDLDSIKLNSNERSAERMWRRDINRFMDNWHERYDIYTQFKLAFSKHGIEV